MTSASNRAALPAALAVGGVGVLALARHRRKRARATRDWQVVTVFLATPARTLPAPLGELGDAIETRWATAPGDKGVELAARPAERSKVDRAQLRQALRHAKMQLEAGEVLQADSPGTTKGTLLNLPLRAATRRAERLGHL
ncbi:hypothetical protein [Motilibacter aurantiacus]|uniref:hypothetical protein n=1 Tax=Motilibacter aurantiacus TaxID=2714955 RepID=UPI0014089B4E|nr:hypothetical protein [Motilibacter aurantiacus]NHC47049.1 hypothetical protein [Motilibacter aurantiacus]